MRKPLYRYPLRQAAANDEVKAWRESHRENIRCRDAMDISIPQLQAAKRLNFPI